MPTHGTGTTMLTWFLADSSIYMFLEIKYKTDQLSVVVISL